MKPTQLFTILSVVLLTLPIVVFAQDFRTELWNPEALAQFLFLGMKPEWLQLPNVIYYVFIPFLVAFTVIYGLLEELKIFRFTDNRGKIQGVIAFSMAFLLLPSGLLTYIVSIFYAFGAFIGLVGFGLLFILGVIFWSYGRGREIYHVSGVQADVIKGLREQIRDLDDKIKRKSDEKMKKIAKGEDVRKEEDELDKLRTEHMTVVERLKKTQEPV